MRSNTNLQQDQPNKNHFNKRLELLVYTSIYFCFFSCAQSWREQEIIQQNIEKEKQERENEIRMKELLLKEKELELEKQKVTIKETLQTGSSIELTCYYDQNAHQKISELLTGAKLFKKMYTP